MLPTIAVAVQAEELQGCSGSGGSSGSGDSGGSGRKSKGGEGAKNECLAAGSRGCLQQGTGRTKGFLKLPWSSLTRDT